MTRHSKKNTDGAVFTYHERRKMDHGSSHLRLPAAAIKPWHRCALTLSPPVHPVITPQGVLYDREAILKNMLSQKAANRAVRTASAVAAARARNDTREKEAAQLAERELAFSLSQEMVHAPESVPNTVKDESEGGGVASNFWLPGSKARDGAGDGRVAKRRQGKDIKHTKCPVTGKRLRARDLISLVLETHKSGLPPAGEQTEVAKGIDEVYLCPVCQTTLVNAVKPVALRTGTVLCMRCVTEFVVKDGRDPRTGVDIDATLDVIPVNNSGTAFAGSAPDDLGSKRATLYRPSAR